MKKFLFLVIAIFVFGLDATVSSQIVKNDSVNVIEKKDLIQPNVKVESNADKLKKIATVHFGIILPTWGGGWMGTAASAPLILTYPEYQSKYGGNVSTFGVGLGADIKLGDKGMFLTFDVENISYDQEIHKKGGTFNYTNPNDGMRYDIPNPLGLKYTTSTVGLRPGIKYAYTKYEKFHPWISLNYGLYIWNVKYTSWDEDKIFGQDSGTSTRLSYGLGVDCLVGKYTITPYMDANAPVANYSMKDLFSSGLGDYNRFDGHLYPGLRF